ncbi:MAG: UDP-N-acetylmuramoyl-L-alanine--D-glutamate ligase [Lachnospiraceae bacterium]|nr:UDP-N-acetylmuramoyl-L-alanine--D-glutamate ligase [Lachnospiraceae bacterium]
MTYKKHAVVLGCGKSGIDSSKLLADIGADVVLCDENDKLVKEEIEEKLEHNPKVTVYIGKISEELTHNADLLVISPGVPVDSDTVNIFRAAGIPVIGEIELAYRFAQGQVVAITGTNGKTTTTTLVGEIMKRRYLHVDVVGNIGAPYTGAALHTVKDSVVVAEISSFQLETIDTFHPHVSAILNITPDHLNRHYTMENYAAVKNAVTRNQNKNDICVLNYDNEYTRKLGENCKATVVWFSSHEKLENGIFLDGDKICLATDGQVEELMDVHEMHLVGMCNYENVMAAIAISRAMKVKKDIYLDTIRNFKAVEHRIEFVEEKGGVVYYNDSKGTNPDAAIQGIRAMDRPTVLIGGGYDKHNEYDEWIEAFDGKVKKLVLIGQTREAIAECAKKHGFTDYVFADTFEEAFQICVDTAEKGDAVLLSPACASWGMFPNYEVRGQMFKDMVRALPD